VTERRPKKEDWDATLASLELGLAALGIPAPLRAAKSVLDMIKRHWTQDGRLASEYEREKALELIEEAIDPLAGAALEQADEFEELKRGQEGIRQHLDQVVDLLLRVVPRSADGSDPTTDGRPAYFEGPRQAPARAIAHFKGRDAELAELEQLLLDNNRTVCLVATGIGGIGKTTLAEEFVATRAPALFPAGTAWLDGAQLAGELARVSRRFGWAQDREPTPEQAIGWLGRELHTKPILLVVDNFDPEHGDPEHVPSPHGQCRTLVTSRARDVHLRLNARRLELGLWTLEVCHEYLRELCPHLARVPDAEVDALAEFVGRLPLGIRLLVSLLTRRQSLRVPEILKLLREQALDALDKYENDRGIAATFRVSYDDLPDSNRRVLQALSVCAKQTRAEIVAAVAGLDDAGELLDDLHARGLAEFTPEAEAPWGLHDVVRMFVLAQPGREEFEVAHTAWMRAHLQEHSEATAWESFATGIDEARRAFERLLAAELGEAIAIYQPLEAHLRDAGRYPESISLSELLLGVAPVDSGVSSIARNNLGLCYEAQGDIPKAIDAHERSLAISERSGNRQGQAASLGNLGTCYRTKGDISKAIDFHERALAINELLGISESQANQLVNLGSCYLTRGDVPKAIDFFERALAIDKQISSPVDQAAAFGNLGLCYKIQGDISKAIDFHERSLAIHEQFGRPEGQAAALGNLGGCYQVQGDVSKAIKFFERSLAIYEKIGSLEGQAIQLGNLGNCYETQGDTPTAIDFLERALAIDEQRGSLEGQATQLGNLGVCYKGQGDVSKAIELFERSLALSEQLGSLEAQAIALGNLGVCCERQGDIVRAADFFQRSLVANEQLGSLEGQAIQLGNLGNFVAKYGDPAQAPHYFNRALKLLRRMGLSDDHPNIVLLTRNWAELAARGPGLGIPAPGMALRSDDASDLADLGDMAELKKDIAKSGRRKRRKKA
jgi:tetratricopeptide (TPR) repeat protein